MSSDPTPDGGGGMTPRRDWLAVPPWGDVPGRTTFWTSLKVQERSDISRLLQLFGRADEAGAEVLGRTLHVQHVLVHEVELVHDATGEVQRLPRTVFLDTEGRSYGFVSTGIVKWVGLVSQLCGQPPWEPALALVVRQVSTRRGFRTYEIELAGPEPGPAPAPGKGGKRG